MGSFQREYFKYTCPDQWPAIRDQGKLVGCGEDFEVYRRDGELCFVPPTGEREMLDPREDCYDNSEKCAEEDMPSTATRLARAIENPTGAENQWPEEVRVSDVEAYELSRKYIYTDDEVVIDNPWRVFIAPSGSHRVQQTNGNVNYIPGGWKVLQWTPRDVDDPVKF